MDILIVEDNKELADLLCDFLRAENYTVSAVQTAEEVNGYVHRKNLKNPRTTPNPMNYTIFPCQGFDIYN